MPKGTLVIRAAEQVGIEIPRFCDHPLLEPVGACRQCLVEVATRPDGTAADAQAAGVLHDRRSPTGMVVRTQQTSAVADKAQQGVMELLLINHPLDCPVCDKGGECPLQNQAMSHGRAESRFDGRQAHLPEADRDLAPRCCSTASGACCARAAPGSPTQIAGDPFIDARSSAARCSRSASDEERAVRVATSPATPCRSARSAR